MDIRRKFQIGLGIILIIITLVTNVSLWFPGIFMIAMGVFNFCPSCQNGACEIDHTKKTDDTFQQ